MAYANGDCFATQYEAPRVIATATPFNTYIQDPGERSYATATPEEVITAKRARHNNPQGSRKRRKQSFELVAKPQIVPIQDELKEPQFVPIQDEPETVKNPRVIDEPGVIRSPRVIDEPVLTRSPRVMLIKNLQDIQFTKTYDYQENAQEDLIRYGYVKQDYEDHTIFESEKFNTSNKVLCEINHRLRRWIAKVKMKQIASQ
jgi:hypothetical protein